MPLGTKNQNAFLMAQLFLAMRPNHRRLAYKELDLTRQDAIFPFLPESLQRLYDPAKAKEINQNLVNLANTYNLENETAVLICHMLEQTFPEAAQDFSSLIGPNPSSDDIDQAVKDIIDNDKLYSAQIGHSLSYLLLHEQANLGVSLAIAKNLLSCDNSEWAGKIIGQMDPEARGKLLEIIQQDINSISDPEAKQLAIKNYADKLVPILNEIYSPNLLKELGSYMQQNLIPVGTPPTLEPSLFLAVVNHRDFSNKFSFEKFIAGAFQKTDKKWLAIQELIHEQMDLSLEIGQGPDRVNRQQVVYGKLADNLQKKITNRLLGNAKIAYKYIFKVDATKDLLTDKEKEASFLIKNHTNIADKAVNDSYTSKDKSNEYYVSCMKLYELAEILKASDKDLDVTGLAENKRAFPDNYNKLKDIKLKLEATSELAEDEYNQAIQELQDLKLDEVVQAELNNLEKELPIAKNLTHYVERIQSELCPYMKKEAAADLIKQIHNLGDILPEFFEQKAFYNFSEKVQKQVFKELSPETQQILINQTSDLEKKAAWLESLPADKAKDLYLSQQQQELILFKMLPATHQEEIAADKKLDYAVYQKFTETLARNNKIVLLKKLHQKRPVAPALANEYKLDVEPAKLDISNSIANMSSGN
ncbi:MAG: hypothetical protein K0S11_1424 [Gammaproteobacteria bacterium]|nr:hypothetical protein [Gammaproteobacteria bacterium]